jgi:hypothetical protein
MSKVGWAFCTRICIRPMPPIGVGVDCALNERLSLTSTFLLNFTDVDTGGGTGATVMPGLTFGVRF